MAKRESAIPTQPRPEVLALLRACKDSPEDDAPRLVLADWLEEHGDESDCARGQYLRLECRAQRSTAESEGCQELKQQADNLWGRYQQTWLAGLKDLGVRRGVRGLLRIDAETRQLATKKGYELARSEAYAWVDGVRSRATTAKGLAKLVDGGLFDSLNVLELTQCHIRAAGVKELARAPRLATLTHLDLHENWIENAGVKLLAEAPLAVNLRVLNLHRNMIWRDGLAALARSPHLRQLRDLDLGFHDLKDGPCHLTGAPWLDGLESLSLVSSGTEDAGLVPLVQSPRVQNLMRLDLGANPLTDTSLAALAASPHLKRLANLWLNQNKIAGPGIEALAASPLLARLRVLHLGWCRLSLDRVRMLVSSPHWGSLRDLALWGADLGDAGARLLAESISGVMDYLGLGSCKIGDAGAEALAAALAAGRVGKLALWSNPLSEDQRQQMRARFGDRVDLGHGR
jgi:uncharacterized protein (TIGR02996 family)